MEAPAAMSDVRITDERLMALWDEEAWPHFGTRSFRECVIAFGRRTYALGRDEVQSGSSPASGSRGTEAIAELIHAAKEHLATHPVYRSKPVAGEGSAARLHQLDKIATEDAPREAIRNAEPPPIQPQPDSDGWIDWEPGLCPTKPDTQVQVKLRGCYGVYDGEAQSFCWQAKSEGLLYSEVVSYRLSPPPSPQATWRDLAMFAAILWNEADTVSNNLRNIAACGDETIQRVLNP